MLREHRRPACGRVPSGAPGWRGPSNSLQSLALLPLRHCDGPLSAIRSAPPAALTAEEVKGQPAPSRPVRFNLSPRTARDSRFRSKPQPISASGLNPRRDTSCRQRIQASSRAPRSAGAGAMVMTIRAAACLSAESVSERSEFSGPRPHRASQGTRAQLGRHCREKRFCLLLSPQK